MLECSYMRRQRLKAGLQGGKMRRTADGRRLVGWHVRFARRARATVLLTVYAQSKCHRAKFVACSQHIRFVSPVLKTLHESSSHGQPSRIRAKQCGEMYYILTSTRNEVCRPLSRNKACDGEMKDDGQGAMN